MNGCEEQIIQLLKVYKQSKKYKNSEQQEMHTAKLTLQQQHSSPNGNSQQVTPFQLLKEQVYPVINKVILKLIDQIVKSHEVQKHEERLKKKKLLDELERKYVDREIQQEQLGSDYEESDDQEYFRKLQMTREVVEAIIHKRLQNTKVKNSKNQQNNDNELEALGGNVFNPIQFIIDELKQYQNLKAQGKLDQFDTKPQTKNTKINFP